MKKKLAAVLAVLCVMGTGAALPAFTGSESPVSSSIAITAAAATTTDVPVAGINAGKYSYAYADTSVYPQAAAAVSKTNWTAENGNEYSLYKVTISGYNDAGKKETVAYSYQIGLKTIKNTTLDTIANETVTIPDTVKETFDAAVAKDVAAQITAEKKAGTLTEADEQKRTEELTAELSKYITAKKVTLIGDNAYKGSYLKTVDLTGIEYIGKSAFQSCQYITEIEIPASVKFVGDSAFASSGLKTLNVKNEMPVIPASLCTATNLTSITFAHPEFIRTIGASAFKDTPVEKPIFQDWGKASGYEPLTVDDSAYENCTAIQTVAMSDNVLILNKNVFKGCTSITDLTFGVNTLGADSGSFEGCTSLVNIKFNDVMQALGGGAFKNCTALEKVGGFPATIKDWEPYGSATGWGFGNSMFSGCTALREVEYPPSVTQILDGAFSGCTNLSAVYKNTADRKAGTATDSTIVLVDKSAFSGCITLETVNYPNATRIADSAFSGCTGLKDFKAEKCEELGASALSGCTAMTSFTAGTKTATGRCTSVGSNALQKCTSMTEITLLSDSYGTSVFKDCSAAETITIYSVGMEKTPDGFFTGCTALKTVKDPEKATALDEVTILSPSTFADCASLTAINLPALRIIEDSAFSGCKELTKISDSGNAIKAENYGSKCFYGCEKLDITVTGDIYTIGASAFQKSGVSAVNITGMAGGTVVIGNSAFADCPALAKATIMAGDAAKFSVGTGLFTNDTALKTVTYEGNQILSNMFKGCTLLSVIYTNATSIKASAFEDCSALTAVKTIDGKDNIIASDIGSAAFKNCASLTVIPSNEATAFDGSSNFAGCTSLTSAGKISKIMPSMFADCTSLNDIILEGISDIPDKAFQNCTGLTKINLDLQKLGNIGANAFAGCSGLTDVTIANAVAVKTSAFANCTQLKNLEVEADSIAATAFQNDESLQKATISTNTIGKSAFSGCAALTPTGLVLKNTDTHTLVDIGASAFANCPALTAAVVPSVADSDLPTIGSKAFGYNANKAIENFYMVGAKGSSAEEYATANKFGFATSLDQVPEGPQTQPTETETKPTETSPSGEEYAKGDVDGSGKVDILDVISINRAVLGKDKLTDAQNKAADINNSGTPDSADSLAIMKFIVGMLSSLD